MKLIALLALATLPGCTAAIRPALIVSNPPVVAAEPAGAPPSMQWLYGSGEGAAMSLQTYRAMVWHVAMQTRVRPRFGVVLAPGPGTILSSYVSCDDKPFAVILDADETAIANLGYEYGLAVRGKSSDGALLDQWQVAERASARAMPGAADAFATLRKMGVTVIINSNRDAPDAAATAATLERAGLGRFVHKETLFMRGDVDGKSGKDGRRMAIARRHCVVAMVGDQLGDFADKFNARGLSPRERRGLAEGHVGMWGHGWFLLSNPVYGPGLKGSIDEVFAPDERWDGEK